MDNEHQTLTIEGDGSENLTVSVDGGGVELTVNDESAITLEVEENMSTLSVEVGNSGNLTLSSLSTNDEIQAMLNYYKGDKGDAGLSAYEQWLTLDGNQGKSFEEFLQDIDCDVSYVRNEPCLVDVGGIKKGQTFNCTIQEVLDALLYPLIDPTLKLSVVGNTNFEIGSTVIRLAFSTEIDLGSYDFYSIELLKNDSESVFTSFLHTNSIQITHNLHKNSTFKAKMVYKSDVLTSSIYSNVVNINFLPKVYWGTSEIKTYDNSFVLGLENSTLTSTTQRNINVNASTTEYIYYVLPSSFSKPTFIVNGFEGGFIKEKTISFTNASGYTSNYDIWRSNQKNLGSLTVTVK